MTAATGKPSGRAPRALACLALLAAAAVGLGMAGRVERPFVFALDGAPESLDFAKASSVRAERVAWLICESLVNVSKNGQTLEPGLAESWTLSADGLAADLRLRKGARFHDGTPVTAAAVRDSLERQFRPEHPLYTAEPRNQKEGMLKDLIASIRVTNELGLSLSLKYPGLHYLTEAHIHSPAALAKEGKAYGKRPVCTGPFKFESWTPERIVATANESYWGGKPKLEQVVFQIFPTIKALSDAILAGQVDFAPAVPDPSLIERFREHDELKLLDIPGLNIFYLGFVTDTPPFQHRDLRRAIVRAIDVQRTAQSLGRGTTLPARGPLPPEMLAYDPAAAQASYDPEAARQLLAKVGYDTSRPIRFVYNSGAAFGAELAHALQRDLQAVGLRVALVGKTNFRDLVEAVQKRDGDLFFYAWHVSAPYPERILKPLFHSSGAGRTNLTRYANPRVDRQLDDVMRLPPGPKQAALYAEIQRIIVDDAPMVFLYHATRMAVASTRVRGLSLRLDVMPADKLQRVALAP